MKKREVVKNKELFNEIIKKGYKVQNDTFIIFFNNNDKITTPNFGIAVSKKLGNAVTRNKIKRRIRNIIDNNKFLFQNSKNYIIMIKRSVTSFEYSKLNKKLCELIKKENK